MVRLCPCRDRTVIGFRTTNAISVNHHWCSSSSLDQGEAYNIKVCQWLATDRWFSQTQINQSLNQFSVITDYRFFLSFFLFFWSLCCRFTVSCYLLSFMPIIYMPFFCICTDVLIMIYSDDDKVRLSVRFICYLILLFHCLSSIQIVTTASSYNVWFTFILVSNN